MGANTKLDLKEMRCEDVDWIHLALLATTFRFDERLGKQLLASQEGLFSVN
jgi:hypothetical protein